MAKICDAGRPVRLQSLSAWCVGLALLLGLAGYLWYNPERIESWYALAGWCLLIPSVARFMAMNYTGSTTYTSLSGVRLEVRVAGPIQAVCGLAGAVLWLVGRFV